MKKMTVCLLNDSFPPTIDGVANATINYARNIQKNHGRAIVATPWYPGVKDHYDFTVVRYASASISKRLGYRGGFPYDPRMHKYLSKQNIDVIHSHCPFMSTLVARVVRYHTGAPIVFTYHTKFDMDIEKRVAFNAARQISLKLLLNNINACDEVWCVSEGAGENLRSLGYEGKYIIMDNGVDFEKRRTEDSILMEMRKEYGIGEDETVFLFVGRMMWYKGLRIAVDGLAKAKAEGARFKMFFVGDGHDRADCEAYAKELGLENDVIFTGAVYDREKLRAYFSLADLFLFPSTYDTNGIVVREAAACRCPSVLIRGSCAAEGITEGVNGLLIDENGDSMAEAILSACADREKLREIGKNAEDQIYLSWEDAVKKAAERYEYVIERYTREQESSALKEEMKELRDYFEQRKTEYAVRYYRFGRQLKKNGLRSTDEYKNAKEKVHRLAEEKIRLPKRNKDEEDL